jgi:ribosomal protein L11 methylase PrmA
MIQDTVRTSSYASFILSNPAVFKGATVLDVGCGTGILSLFAAQAGAKRVFAVDASDIAEKAEKIVRVNNMENIITYDCLFCSVIYEYPDRFRAVLSEVKLRISLCRMALPKWTSSSRSGWDMPFCTSLC